MFTHFIAIAKFTVNPIGFTIPHLDTVAVGQAFMKLRQKLGILLC